MPTLRRPFRWLAAVAGLVCVGHGATAHAQVIHLPPAHKRILPSDVVILVIKRKPLDTTRDDGRVAPAPVQQAAPVPAHTDSAAIAKAAAEKKTADDARAAAEAAAVARIVIDDGQLLVQLSDRTVPIPMGNRTVRDVVNQIRADVTELEVTSDYPLYPASDIGTLKATVLKPNETVSVYANSDEPDLRIGFGVVLALADPKSETENSGILTQTGFQLDVVGSHQLLGRKTTQSKARPLIYTQFRLGLNGDQQLQIKPADNKPAATDASLQLEQALGQADQVALGGQVDFEWESWTPKINFVLTPSYAVNWTRLSTPPFPRIPVDGALKPAEDVFTAAALQRTREDWARVKPLDEIGLMLTANFLRQQIPLYYAGLGITRREILIPGVRYARPAVNNAPGPIDTESLQGIADRTDVRVWRAVLGTRLAGVIDLRVDASGSIGAERVEPLLRVLIARAFPIGQ